MTVGSKAPLVHEAEYLWPFVLPGAADPELVQAYVAANAEVFGAGAQSASVNVALIVERGLDAEAIEVALRRRGPRNALTQKMQILIYLAEARRAYFPLFVNERAAPLRAFLLLTWATLRAAFKLAKGHYLLARYELQ